MRTRVLVIAASLAAAAHAGAAPPAATGIGLRLGTRFGVAFPLGDIGNDQELSELVTRGLPIWIDAAYRFDPHFSAGLYLAYGFGFADGCQAGASCSTHAIHLGAEAFYHFLPAGSFDPYVGLGSGWEWMSWGGTAGAQHADFTVDGWEFLTLHAGGDFRLASQLAVGPYLASSLGQYSGCTGSLNHVDQPCNLDHQGLHEWFQLGLRGSFDF